MAEIPYDPVLAGMVRILDANGIAVGAGFVLSISHDHAYGLIATSSRVIECATSLPIEQAQESANVRIIFHIDASERCWETSIRSWSASTREDVSILQVTGTLPARVRPLSLARATVFEGRRVSVFGYPAMHGLTGRWAYCEMCRPGPKQNNTDQTLLQLQTQAMTEEYRGAPVWDDARRKVVGMISQVDQQGSHEGNWIDVYAAPIESVQLSYKDVLSDVHVDIPSPYHGLEPFTENDAASFFGYDEVTNKLAILLDTRKDQRIFTVLGPVGSGKTSVVQAGLVPKLRHREVDGYDDWGIFITRLSDEPFAQLEAQGVQDASQHLRDGLHIWCQRHDCKGVVFVLDQFEQVLCTCPADIQRRFVEQLIDVVREGVATIILVLRDEFYSQLARHEELATRIEDGIINVFAPHTREALRNIAYKRAQIAGAIDDPALIEPLLESVFTATEETPRSRLLRYEQLCTQTKQSQDQAAQAGMAIDLEASFVGLGDFAESVLCQFDKRWNTFIKHLFIQMVIPGDEREGLADTGKNIFINRICTNDDEYQIVNELANKGLLSTERDQRVNDMTAKIANDKLIHEWPQLRQWLDEYRQFLTWQEAIENKSRRWLAAGAHEDRKMYLLHDFELSEAENWLPLYSQYIGQDIRDFIEVSKRQNILEVKFAYNQIKEGGNKQAIADLQARTSLARRLVTQAAFIYEQHPDLLQTGVLLAAESHALIPSPEADKTLRYGLDLLPRPVTHIPFQNDIGDVQFSRDGRYIAVVIKPTTVEIWNLISGSLHKRIPLHAPILALYFDNSADSLVTLTRDGTVAVWDTAHGTPLFSYKEVDLLTAATFSSDGHFLAVASWNGTSGTIKVWEIKPWRAQAFLNKTPYIRRMAFHPGKSELVIGYQHGKVRIWNVLYEELGIYKHMQASLESIAFSPGGTYLAMASKAGELLVLETDSWNPLLDMQDNGCVHTLLFSPQGDYLVAGCDDGKVKIWEIPAVRELPPLVHTWPVRAMTWSFDNTYLVTTGKGLTASIWDIRTRQEVMRLTHNKNICRMAFSMHGHYLFTAGHDRSIRVWEVIKSKHRIQSMQQNFMQEGRNRAFDNNAVITPMSEIIKEHVNTHFYSYDRQYVAITEDNDIVGIWNAVDGTHITNLPYGGKNSAIAFSSDGAYLAIGSSDRDLCIWETNTGQHIARLSHTANIRKLSFSSDGRHLTVECCDGTVTIWLWRPEDMLKEVSRYVTRGLSEEEWKRYIGDRPYHPAFRLA